MSSGDENVLRDAVDLYCLYGARLKSILQFQCDDTPKEYAIKIAENCPNVAVRLVEVDTDPNNLLGVFGPQTTLFAIIPTIWR